MVQHKSRRTDDCDAGSDHIAVPDRATPTRHNLDISAIEHLNRGTRPLVQSPRSCAARRRGSIACNIQCSSRWRRGEYVHGQRGRSGRGRHDGIGDTTHGRCHGCAGCDLYFSRLARGGACCMARNGNVRGIVNDRFSTILSRTRPSVNIRIEVGRIEHPAGLGVWSDARHTHRHDMAH